MATSTTTVRVIIMPWPGDDGLVNNLFSLPALQQAQTNGWFSQMYVSIGIDAQIIGSTPLVLIRTLRVELVTTAANDANLIATSLPALQTQMGYTSPILTWSYTATMGY